MLGQLVKRLLRRLLSAADSNSHAGSRDIKALLNEATAGIKVDDTQRAQKALQRIVELEPHHAEALYQLGCIAQDTGQTDAALEWVAKAMAADPRAARFYNTYGNLKYAQKELDGAAKSYAEAIRIQPDFAEAYTNLGMVLCERGEIAEGVQLFNKAIEVDPRQYHAHHNLGNARQALGEFEAAVACYQRALEITPDAVETQYSLGASLQALGRFDAALAAYQRALELKPDHAETHYRLGNVLYEMDRFDDALACLNRAICLRRDFHEAYNGLGIVLLKQGNPDDAVPALNHAIALRPDFAEAHNNLGMALQRLGKFDNAIAAYRRALEAKPDFVEAHSNLICALGFDPHIDTAEEQAERRRWRARHVQSRRFGIRPHENTPDPDRRLRIGYVSADFQRHSAASGFGLMLLHYDRSQYEVACYSNSVREDDITARFRGSVGKWRTIFGMSDEAVADVIRADGIDILVDLPGHSAGNRLLVFARKPAPLQVTAWGHATGTGLEEMDYLFSDETTIPPQWRHYYSEKVLYLPCVISYMPQAEPPPLETLPAQRNGYVTFGFFNKALRRAIVHLRRFFRRWDSATGSRKRHSNIWKSLGRRRAALTN